MSKKVSIRHRVERAAGGTHCDGARGGRLLAQRHFGPLPGPRRDARFCPREEHQGAGRRCSRRRHRRPVGWRIGLAGRHRVTGHPGSRPVHRRRTDHGSARRRGDRRSRRRFHRRAWSAWEFPSSKPSSTKPSCARGTSCSRFTPRTPTNGSGRWRSSSAKVPRTSPRSARPACASHPGRNAWRDATSDSAASSPSSAPRCAGEGLGGRRRAGSNRRGAALLSRSSPRIVPKSLARVSAGTAGPTTSLATGGGRGHAQGSRDDGDRFGGQLYAVVVQRHRR